MDEDKRHVPVFVSYIICFLRLGSQNVLFFTWHPQVWGQNVCAFFLASGGLGGIMYAFVRGGACVLRGWRLDAYGVAHGRAALLLGKLVCVHALLLVWSTWEADWLADPCG